MQMLCCGQQLKRLTAIYKNNNFPPLCLAYFLQSSQNRKGYVSFVTISWYLRVNAAHFLA